ncbi:FAD-dependent oxidoreductase [Georgenia sp. SYP-B2076]|uniref:FAD-dependent oxidoreductase n=1 Tax=Georgenia sp. SYP-B2076 TaxID=2495881 RepID=UPI001F0C8367|nr:FAD-dependent oxidoreductase [Georgenia sp. SYP-B2076]
MGTSTDDSVVPDTTTCCIVGCGPAGAMLGLMLARAGVDVVVLEKHADFFRDFRGDTVHASTLTVLDELGLIDRFARVPQQRTTAIAVMTDDGTTTMADFTGLPGKYPYITMVPQWDFLDFVTGEASRYPSFRLLRNAEAYGLITQDGAVRGVRYRDARGTHELRALLTVAADGRSSVLRRAAGLPVIELGAPMDVLWYRLPKTASDPPGSFARLTPGRILPMLDRGTYWQGAYTMPKGSFAELKARGIDALHQDLRQWLPFMADRVESITDWDDVGFLEVRMNRLRRWHRPGFLCIGDAAHAMSPVGGVGINMAVQDAVAAANALIGPLLAGQLTEDDLRAVQRRREFPTRMTQRMQRIMQRAMISPALEARHAAQLPTAARAALRVSLLRRLLSRLIGIGFRAEHVRDIRHAASPHAPKSRPIIGPSWRR